MLTTQLIAVNQMKVLKKPLKRSLCPILRWTLPKATAELYHFHAHTSVLTKRLQAARKSNLTMFLLLTKLPCLMARNGRRRNMLLLETYSTEICMIFLWVCWMKEALINSLPRDSPLIVLPMNMDFISKCCKTCKNLLNDKKNCCTTICILSFSCPLKIVNCFLKVAFIVSPLILHNKVTF